MRKGDDTKSLRDFHNSKEGTPTMGGVLIIGALVLSTLVWGDLLNKYTLLALLATLWLGAIGLIDDRLKMIKKRSKGLGAMTKLRWQLLIGLVIGVILYADKGFPAGIEVPFFKNLIINLGLLYILFTAVVIVGSSNAVNLTDGLDGLAIGTMIMIALTYTIMSYLTGHAVFSDYLNIFFIPGSGELVVFCAALMGASLGFLWFNSYPATVFMGDTGSLALGGA
ncbi:MAG: phospho-N-acetylmuramoyl-pentapeptide-transferase, partial [Candidatus Omnitrophica bacterium]|nr:phospho-N-acetylmuramoyl-pentapeptide-transferase [Candidatus Omnitrophota bacterium]